MAKFYQHMQPGETLGKITRLRYIDDINDDELILYVFEDGSKCNEEYIAEINNTDAFNKFMMVELTDPLNKWTFKESEFKLSQSKYVTGDDGQRYEVPEPGISVTRDQQGNYITGDHAVLTMNEEGQSKSNVLPYDGKRIEATPPRVIKNKTVEPRENYLLSLHPELINGPIKEDNKISADLLSHSIQPQKQPDYALNSKLNKPNKPNKTQQTVMGSKSPITTDIIETVKHASIVINLDELNNFKEYDTVKLIINNKTEEYPMEEFIKKILYLTETETTAAEIQNTNKNTQYKEDMFITNMIDKSKKKNCTIGVDFGLELPPKEVYNTIKTIYSDELAHDFVTALANRLNYEQLKESVGNGLTLYYEGNMPNRNQ